MKTRRQFVKEGSMAVAAIAAFNPIDSLASFTSGFSGTTFRQVTFLHTALPAAEISSRLNKLKYDHRNPLLIQSGNNTGKTNTGFDASAGSLPEEFEGNYQIIKKGSVTIGVIEAFKNEWNLAGRVNHLAGILKKEKGCDLVVCLSDLGFSSRAMLDDTRLAAQSQNLDIIIGKSTSSSPVLPYIALNKNRAEVILHYSSNRDLAIGNIKIVFDNAGNKRGVEFDHPFHPKGKTLA